MSSDDDDVVPLAVPKPSSLADAHSGDTQDGVVRRDPVPVTLVTRDHTVHGSSDECYASSCCCGPLEPCSPQANCTLPVCSSRDRGSIDTPCPDRILCAMTAGVLGAGKSTLVRHILTADHGYRIAVILNEFGDDTSIERAIVSDEQVQLTAMLMFKRIISYFSLGLLMGTVSTLLSTAKPCRQGKAAVSAEEWVELANGCLCCSVKTEFVTALEGLLRRRSGFDYILIETTGKS